MALSQSDCAALVAAVDNVDELSGSGIGFLGKSGTEIVRSGSGYYVMFEVVPDANPYPVSANPGRESKVLHEMRDMFLNCSAAAAAAIGEIVFAAGAAPTGGATGVAAIALWAGATASAFQCSVSTVRVYNSTAGNSKDNDVLDQSISSPAVNYTLDAIGIGSAVFSGVGAVRFATAARDAGAIGTLARGSNLSRPMRAAMSTAIGNPGGVRRLTTAALSARARYEMLGALSGGLSLTSSTIGGIGNRLVVYLAK